jgi:hypothetical protein
MVAPKYPGIDADIEGTFIDFFFWSKGWMYAVDWILKHIIHCFHRRASHFQDNNEKPWSRSS